jgi:hypothetical protein
MNASKRRSALMSFVCVTAVTCILTVASEAVAQTSGPRSTAVTFSGPVQVAGVMLPEGTYVFEHVSTSSGNEVVTISSGRPKRQVARLQAVGTRRAALGPVVTFRPTRSGSPAAIGAWYLNGGVEGYEFLYTSDQLRALAAPSAAPSVASIP